MFLPEGAFSTFLLLRVCVSNSCIGDSISPPKNPDRTKGASPSSTSKAQKHPLAKAPFRQAREGLDPLKSKVRAYRVRALIFFSLLPVARQHSVPRAA